MKMGGRNSQNFRSPQPRREKPVGENLMQEEDEKEEETRFE